MSERVERADRSRYTSTDLGAKRECVALSDIGVTG